MHVTGFHSAARQQCVAEMFSSPVLASPVHAPSLQARTASAHPAGVESDS